MTMLTYEMLMSAMDALRRACPACGGRGVIFEDASAVLARLELGLDYPAQFSMTDLLFRSEYCPACHGSGVMRSEHG